MNPSIVHAGARLFAIGQLSILALLATVACGQDANDTSQNQSVGGSSSDAGPADTQQPDAASPGADALAATTRVTVFSDGEPLAGADVVFHSTDGEVLTVVKTESDGTASTDSGAVGMVTVAVPTTGLVTIFDVKPGDELIVGQPVAVKKTVGTISVSTAQVVQGAPDYVVDIGTSIETAADLTKPVEVDVPAANLLGGGGVTVLAYARDKDGVPVYWSQVAGVAVSGAGVAPAELGPWSGNWGSHIVRITNSPKTATWLHVVAAPAIGVVPYRSINDWQSVPPAMEANLFQFAMPDGFASLVEVTAVVGYGELNAGNDSVLVRRIQDPTLQIDVDGTADTLPQVSGAACDLSAPARPVLQWTQTDALCKTDGLLVEVRWTQGAESRKWLGLAAPCHSPSLRFPVLPAALAALAPDNASQLNNAAVTFVEADYIADFEALRREHGPSVLLEPLPAAAAAIRFSTAVALP